MSSASANHSSQHITSSGSGAGTTRAQTGGNKRTANSVPSSAGTRGKQQKNTGTKATRKSPRVSLPLATLQWLQKPVRDLHGQPLGGEAESEQVARWAASQLTEAGIADVDDESISVHSAITVLVKEHTIAQTSSKALQTQNSRMRASLDEIQRTSQDSQEALERERTSAAARTERFKKTANEKTRELADANARANTEATLKDQAIRRAHESEARVDVEVALKAEALNRVIELEEELAAANIRVDEAEAQEVEAEERAQGSKDKVRTLEEELMKRDREVTDLNADLSEVRGGREAAVQQARRDERARLTLEFEAVKSSGLVHASKMVTFENSLKG